jgi:hypothetical protein
VKEWRRRMRGTRRKMNEWDQNLRRISKEET